MCDKQASAAHKHYSRITWIPHYAVHTRCTEGIFFNISVNAVFAQSCRFPYKKSFRCQKYPQNDHYRFWQNSADFSALRNARSRKYHSDDRQQYYADAIKRSDTVYRQMPVFIFQYNATPKKSKIPKDTLVYYNIFVSVLQLISAFLTNMRFFENLLLTSQNKYDKITMLSNNGVILSETE